MTLALLLTVIRSGYAGRRRLCCVGSERARAVSNYLDVIRDRTRRVAQAGVTELLFADGMRDTSGNDACRRARY